MQLKEIYKPIEKELGKVEERMQATLKNGGQAVSPISDYILNIQGKRLRPALVLLSAKTGKANPDKAVDLAASIELIHTATLIHDDIIDNAQVRRGHPSLNVKFGKDTAILFGDYLYSKAFEIISALNIPKITNVLLRTTNAICQGEMQQLRRVFQPVGEKEYLEIISDKTASLFSACCETGGTITGAKKKQIQALKEYGHNLGMLFQITDDCLDVVGDEREGKMTLPLIYLRQFPRSSESQAIAYALAMADKFERKALAALDYFDESPIKEGLKGLIRYVNSRVN